MRVDALFLKPRAGAPMVRVPELRGVAGLGLVGDVAARASSPRHVLIASSEDVAALALPIDALRANILLAGPTHALASGTVLRIGALELRITLPCEACHRLDDARPGLARTVGPRRGQLARILTDGVVHEGARATLTTRTLPALAGDWRTRVRAIVHAIPHGQFVTYTTLVEVAGVQRTYCRALPPVLRKLRDEGAPVHRVVPADPARVARDDAARLAAERPAPWAAAAYYARAERASTEKPPTP